MTTHTRRRLVTASALLLAAAPLSRAALTITPTFDASITSDANAANIENTINSALAAYPNTFTDNVNVTITFQESSSGLGESSSFFATIPYTTYRTALAADAKSANDATALAHLPLGPDNPVTGTPDIDLKLANARALGLAGFNPPSGQHDGTISLNTHITDIGSPGTSGSFSLFATVQHEVDEVLGLGSSLPDSTTTPSPEDLFRYDSAGNRSFTTSSTAKAFFSINSTTDLAQFDNQNDGGDFGDWQSNPLPPGVSPQVQDAFATPGAHPVLGPNEITALDVIGYDVAVPEPASASLLLAAAIPLLTRRRRS